MAFTSDKYTAAQARVSERLNRARQKHIENSVPKLDSGQRQYLAQQLGNPATMNAAIAKYGSASVDEFLKQVVRLPGGKTSEVAPRANPRGDETSEV